MIEESKYYGYKSVCADDNFSKPFKTYLGKDGIHSSITSTIEESKYCSDMTKKHLNKELVKTQEDDENFKYSTK